MLSFDIVNVQGRLIFVFSRINKLQSNVDGLWTSQKEGYNDKNIYYHCYDLALIHFDIPTKDNSVIYWVKRQHNLTAIESKAFRILVDSF